MSSWLHRLADAIAAHLEAMTDRLESLTAADRDREWCLGHAAGYTEAMAHAGQRILEDGRRLASERDDLVAAGVDPVELEVPLAPFVVVDDTTGCHYAPGTRICIRTDHHHDRGT